MSKNSQLKKGSQSHRLYEYVKSLEIGKEISIDALCASFGNVGVKGARRKQQHLGALITRVNRHLEREGLKVVPGLILKKTYRVLNRD